MPQITKIEPQKNKLDRVNIYVDHEFFCAMQYFVCIKYGLKENLEISKEQLYEYVLESDKEKALNSVAKLLKNNLKTKKQIEAYLKQKGYDNHIISFVTEKLQEYNYINDEYFASLYVNNNKRKYGKNKLEFELRQKGVSESNINKVLSGYKADEEILIKLAEKYLKNKQKTFENLQKLSNHLAYKGFSWEEINKVIRHFKKEL